MARLSDALHVGKRTQEAKTMVTERMHDLIAEKARAAGCTPSDLVHDILYLVLTGKTFADHVADDRRAVLLMEGREQGDNRASQHGGRLQ